MTQNLKNMLKHNTFFLDQGRTLQIFDKTRYFFSYYKVCTAIWNLF